MTPPLWTLSLYQAVMILAAVLSVPCLLMYRNRWMNRAGSFLMVGVTVAWASRLNVASHLPMFGAYESALSLAFFTGVILLLESRDQSYFSFYPSIVALLLYHGGRYSSNVYALTISERGFWVHLHSLAAFVSFGLAVLLVFASVLTLLKREVEIKKILLIFYLFYTLTIISGSFYSFLLFGKPWTFDPIETMNLASFLALTTLLHVVSFENWSPRKTAPWTILCCLLLVLAYRLILLFPPESTYHIFDIDLRIHVTK